MDRRTIGKTDLTSGSFGLGCNRMIDAENGDMIAVAHRAIDIGMNQFDGADVYGFGKCEDFLGKVLKQRRDEATIVSKFGMVRTPEGQASVNVRPDYVRSACDASLKRLNMDHIDLYYQHRMDLSVPIEETVGAMAGLVKAGKVRALGLCNTTPELIKRAHKIHPIAAVQMEYSLMERGVEKGVLPTCQKLGITFVAYGPLTYAFLAGEVKTRADLPANDQFRGRMTRFTDENLSHNVKMLTTINAIADEVDATPAQVALAWCLHRPWDVLPIPGSSKPKHLRENARAASIKLSPAQVKLLDKTFAPSAVKGAGAQMAPMRSGA
jgi:aryl-alcohol dehydrogenase-like predicted oxidoreductase